MTLLVHACRACGHQVYPVRLWCPACGHDQADPVAVEDGELLAWTTIAGGEGGLRLIATVRVLPAGPELVVRIAPESADGLRAGQRLALWTRPQDGFDAPWAGAARPD